MFSKKDFPIFQTHPGLVYLDSASTSQKPQQVIDAVTNFYVVKNANIHRGIYKLAEEATAVYEQTRDLVAKFINAYSRDEVIFTGNTNQSINLFAEGWGRKFLTKGDVVVLSEMEHHANIVPWLRLRDEIGIVVKFIPINSEGILDLSSFWPSPESHSSKPFRDSGQARMTGLDISKVKLLSLTHISNVLGTINPIAEIIVDFKKQNPRVKILIDAAQSIAHLPIDVRKLDCDAIAFSSHKMLGPAGVGVLWAKKTILEEMDPFYVGSHMIKTVTKEEVVYSDAPDKFEAGTGNLEGVAGLGAAVKYLQNVGLESIKTHDMELTDYGLKKLQAIPYLKLFGPQTSEDRIGIFSFAIPGVHPHDIAQVLDSNHIAIRSGHHCCQVLMNVLNVPATARASLYLYNSNADIDALVAGIEKVKKTFKL
jgi:cysteine desulfurase/selenocysteine lyase